MRVTQLRGQLLVASFAAVFMALSPAACTSLLGDFDSGTPDAGADGSSQGTDATTDGAPANDSGVPLGTACTTGTQCGSGFCADGVCCNNACSGTCESCNQGGAKTGTCSPIAVNTDPDKECVMVAPPVADGGAGDSGSDDAGADAGDAAPGDAGDASARDAAFTDADTDAGPSLGYNPPDGGVQTDNAKCTGSCDGKGGNGGGACAYPDNTKVCGTQFCNTSTQKAGFVCDGAGHCNLGLTNCTDYSCSSTTGTCGSSCSSQADCLPTDYCDGLNCHLKRGSGVPCTGPSECNSGFCDNAVCCDTDCSMTTGGNCNLTAAKAGTCSCSACATGPCAVYYKDSDSDGYGDLAAPTVACAAGPVPTGYVTNSKDCDDGDANVNPAQTGYFRTPSLGKHTYDYNCDGSLEKGIPEYPSYYGPSYCGFCGSPQSTTPACSVASYSCTSSGAQSTLGCSEYFGLFLAASTTASKVTTLPAVTTQSVPIICRTCGYSYCGTSPTADPTWQSEQGSGLAGTYNCGATGTFIYCGTCSSNTGSPYSYSSTAQQTCH